MSNMDLHIPAIPFDDYSFTSITLYPSLKPPVVFKGCLLLVEEVNLVDELVVIYSCYLTESLDLVLVRQEEIPGTGDIETSPDYFTRIRKIKKYCDVWTFFKNCERNQQYIEFLKGLSTLVSGSESFFWLPL